MRDRQRRLGILKIVHVASLAAIESICWLYCVFFTQESIRAGTATGEDRGGTSVKSVAVCTIIAAHDGVSGVSRNHSV